MGTTTSKDSIQKALSAQHSTFPEDERYIGLENFGNTCYCNSVLQALYFCIPLRQQIMMYIPPKEVDAGGPHLLACLADLFVTIAQNKKRFGAIPPRKFVTRLRRDNEIFRSPQQHQDAHEFLNFMLNQMDEILQKEHHDNRKERCRRHNCLCIECAFCCTSPSSAHTSNSSHHQIPPLPIVCCCCRSKKRHATPMLPPVVSASPSLSRGASPPPSPTARRADDNPQDDRSAGGGLHKVPHSSTTSNNVFSSLLAHNIGSEKEVHCDRCNCHPAPASRFRSFVHEVFEGVTSSETRCLNCEAVTSREEKFIDLSVDVEQNVSVTQCLRSFSSSELLNSNDKFFCNSCNSLQEAHKSIVIKSAPKVLALHLKRFKYIERCQRFQKLSYRVSFPFELRLPNVNATEMVKVFHLFAVVIHVGSGPNMGHYVSMIKSGGNWLLFDDDEVSTITERQVQSVFGVGADWFVGTTQTGYILFYSEEDMASSTSSLLTPPMASSSTTVSSNSSHLPSTSKKSKKNKKSPNAGGSDHDREPSSPSSSVSSREKGPHYYTTQPSAHRKRNPPAET